MDEAALFKKHSIGLSGGIASGKSTVGRMIAAAGFPLIDADQLARLAVEPGTAALKAIVESFGGSVLLPDGCLNRARMGALVFADRKLKETLEAIVHPAIESLLLERLRRDQIFAQRKTWFYEATLLFETGSYRRFGRIWLCACDEVVQLQRLMTRNQITREAAQAIVAQQLPNAHKKKLADLLIDTNGNIASVEAQVQTALSSLSVGDGS